MPSPAATTPPFPPEEALRPGRRDAVALLVVWYLRKASYGIIALGLVVGVVVARTSDVTIGGGTPEELRSPFAGVAVGVLVRVLVALAALALAYPLARAREASLPPRTYFGSSVTGVLDRLHVARAYRSLRWTHHVRQVALARLGRIGGRLSHLDPIIDAVNVTLVVLAIAAIVVLG